LCPKGKGKQGTMPSLLEKLQKRATQAGVSDTPGPPLFDPEEGYPIPTDEAEFAADERAAIIEFDGDGRDGLIQNVLQIFQGRYAQAR
jgi:hypothetical protein